MLQISPSVIAMASRRCVRCAFIKEHHHEHRIRVICRVLQAHLSGYYAWCKEPLLARSRENQSITSQINSLGSRVVLYTAIARPMMIFEIWVTDIIRIRTHEGWPYRHCSWLYGNVNLGRWSPSTRIKAVSSQAMSGKPF